MHREIELKFRVDDPDALRAKLQALGARSEGRFHEENEFCDDDSGSLGARKRILRLRRSTGTNDGQTVVEQRVTYKEPADRSPAQVRARFKVRSEVEVVVDDLENMRLIFDRLGYSVRFGYEKEREIWHLDGVLVTLDTLPFGHFSELEGSPEAIATVAGRLGFDLAEGTGKSYLTLMAEYRQSQRSQD